MKDYKLIHKIIFYFLMMKVNNKKSLNGTVKMKFWKIFLHLKIFNMDYTHKQLIITQILF